MIYELYDDARDRARPWALVVYSFLRVCPLVLVAAPRPALLSRSAECAWCAGLACSRCALCSGHFSEQGGSCCKDVKCCCPSCAASFTRAFHCNLHETFTLGFTEAQLVFFSSIGDKRAYALRSVGPGDPCSTPFQEFAALPVAVSPQSRLPSENDGLHIPQPCRYQRLLNRRVFANLLCVCDHMQEPAPRYRQVGSSSTLLTITISDSLDCGRCAGVPDTGT